MKAIKVRELKQLCDEQIRKGNGDKTIMISNDDEGNGYHYLWYSFTPIEELLKDDYLGIEYMVSENVAPLKDTIILG